MFTRSGHPCCCVVMLYVVDGSEREQCHLLHSLPAFSHLPHYSQSNWALLVLLPSGWACVHSGTLLISPMSSPVSLGVSPTADSTPTGVFNKRFEALFPCTETLGCTVCPTPQLFLPVYLLTTVGPTSPKSTTSTGPPATALARVLSAHLPISTPPTSLDECFSLVV